jgi:RNA polymerase sigma factor (sigma-70 family)
MKAPTREDNLARQALKSGVLEKRATRWARHYGGLVGADELESVGNTALAAIVREYDPARSGFEEFCRWRLDLVMLTSLRAEARDKRIDRAAQLAAADLLSTFQSAPRAPAAERVRDVARATAAATFVAQAEEAQHGGEDDAAEREQYKLALAIIAAVILTLPHGQQRLFVLHFQDGMRLSEVRKILQIHQNTAEAWRKKGLAEIRKALEKQGIQHAPGRGGGARLYVLDGLRAPEDRGREDRGDEDEDDEDDEAG